MPEILGEENTIHRVRSLLNELRAQAAAHLAETGKQSSAGPLSDASSLAAATEFLRRMASQRDDMAPLFTESGIYELLSMNPTRDNSDTFFSPLEMQHLAKDLFYPLLVVQEADILKVWIYCIRQAKARIEVNNSLAAHLKDSCQSLNAYVGSSSSLW